MLFKDNQSAIQTELNGKKFCEQNSHHIDVCYLLLNTISSQKTFRSNIVLYWLISSLSTEQPTLPAWTSIKTFLKSILATQQKYIGSQISGVQSGCGQWVDTMLLQQPSETCHPSDERLTYVQAIRNSQEQHKGQQQQQCEMPL